MSNDIVVKEVDKTSSIQMWSDGQAYEPEDEAYRPVYSYAIKTPDWEYTANDIKGGVNQAPDTHKGMQVLLSFLYACQEGFLKQYAHEESENAGLFPPHVREWAYNNSEELSMIAADMEIAIIVVHPKTSDPSDNVGYEDQPALHHCPDCDNTCAINDYSDGRCRECTSDQ